MQSRKTLVIVAHPHLHDESRVNARWVDELKKHSDKIELHELAVSGDGSFDVAAERALLESHDAIVFQFPLYWYSCPPILRAWEDVVYGFGWAYGGPRALSGEMGRKMAGKKLAYAVSAGEVADRYGESGTVGFGVEQVLAPFYATANYLGAQCLEKPWVLYGAEVNLSDEELERNAEGYAKWVLSL